MMITFRGASISHEPTQLPSSPAKTPLKYRGQSYKTSQAIASSTESRGLTYRGVAY